MIEIADFTFRYGKHVALDHVNLTVKKGEIAILAGANGAGKTTLLRVISGVLLCQPGKIRIDNVNVGAKTKQKTAIYSRKVLVRDQEQGKYFIFSLEDNNFEEIPMPYHPYFYLEKGNRFIIVWASGDEISVGEIIDGKLVMKKEWVTPIPIRGIRIIRVYDSGIVVFNPKEFETYWF